MRAQLDQQQLIEAAAAARANAFIPFSRFAVGAAALTSTGKIFGGCNIESAAYPATICAERVAVSSAYAAGERDIVALAVIADTDGPVSPCGTCRQVLFELAPHCAVILTNLHGDILATTPAELLPGGFTADSLPGTHT